MPDEPKPTPEVEQEPAGLSPEALAKELEKTRREAAKYRTKANELEAAQNKAREDALAEQGKWKELAEQRERALADATARITAVETAQAAELDEVLADMEEADRGLVPASLPISERLAFARKLKARIAKQPTPGTAGATGGRGGTKEHGGYKDDIEWAKKDYAGYKKFRDSQHN